MSTAPKLEVHTLAELMAMSRDELDARAHRNLLARQRVAFEAVTAGRCTLACLATTERWGECSCVCGGRHHAALWSTSLVPMGDWG